MYRLSANNRYASDNGGITLIKGFQWCLLVKTLLWLWNESGVNIHYPSTCLSFYSEIFFSVQLLPIIHLRNIY